MTKVATIASLVRNSARSEQDFIDTVVEVFEEADVERIWEYFDRLNIPRSVGAEGGLTDPIPTIENVACMKVWDYDSESKLSKGIQRFLDRHERKIRWHAGHPSPEGAQNVLLLFRAAMMITNLRLTRLRLLLRSKDELNPNEWAIARRLMNRSYLSFRNFLGYVANDWVDAMQNAVGPDELASLLGNFYELVDIEVRQLEEMRELLEERRLEMTVLPEGYPPVKPPNYFGGDLLGRGPWKQYWLNISSRAHHFRESVG